ncbi:MarR family winged helix-turn-helix transcriptional regulator [Mycolicibacterium nivoides]|uniref:MarR family winged helix-turn-helix transcriptional regulator n=1 Tax=Mycolicibacterium nivoides TaxID=2487344 RepID=A0ABW9LLY4_9MYCO
MEIQATDDGDAQFLHLGRLVSRAARLYARAADQALSPLGLRHAYIPVIAALRGGQTMNQTALAAEIGMEQPSMAELLGRMQRDNLVSVSRHPSDARRRVIGLTPEAMPVLDEAHDRLIALQRWALAGFTPQDTAALGHALEKLTDNLDQGPR